MCGGRFLVSLLEVSNSERILRLSSIIKEGINFWEEDIKKDIDIESMMSLIYAELSNTTTEIFEAELNDDSKEVAVTIGGYIAKKTY